MFLSVANAWPAFDSLARIFFQNFHQQSSWIPGACSFIGPFVLAFILICLVFVMLTLSPLFCAVVESSSVFDCMSEKRLDVRQMSSSKSRSSS